MLIPRQKNQLAFVLVFIVYDAQEERGYNAIDQMVGYILSGDPSYITSHNNARKRFKCAVNINNKNIFPVTDSV